MAYIDSAFRSSRADEAYMFMKNAYILENYAPGTTDDHVVNGPLLISDGFPSLRGTPFAQKMDCAFGIPGTNCAYIFSGNICAKIDYAPGTKDDRIIEGPMPIVEMFPCLKNTGFDEGLDAAFESSSENEAFIFSGKYYATLNYAEGRRINTHLIIDGFACLGNTVFETGIGAAFASHRDNEAYLFKDKYYAVLHFTPGSSGDYLAGGVREILPYWPSLRNILPIN